MRTIAEQCFEQNQSWMYIYVGEVDGVRLRVEIRRNAYDAQSYAKIDKWNGEIWNFVHSMPITSCYCKRISYVMENVTKEDFQADAMTLISVALDIVGN
jgi:hypothetical protein